jgi:hypothetical protein
LGAGKNYLSLTQHTPSNYAANKARKNLAAVWGWDKLKKFPTDERRSMFRQKPISGKYMILPKAKTG